MSRESGCVDFAQVGCVEHMQKSKDLTQRKEEGRSVRGESGSVPDRCG